MMSSASICGQRFAGLKDAVCFRPAVFVPGLEFKLVCFKSGAYAAFSAGGGGGGGCTFSLSRPRVCSP